FFLLLTLLSINCNYMNPGNLNSELENIMEPTQFYGFLLLSIQSAEASTNFPASNFQVTNISYPNLKFNWTVPVSTTIVTSKAFIGISDKPITTDEECINNLITSNNSVSYTSGSSKLSSPITPPLTNNQDYPIGGYTDSNLTTKYCSICTQGATLYVCARTFNKSNSANVSKTLPWTGERVQFTFN
ncbi:MAG: hypothetical protein KDK36_16905, partial [Leptospiraceae bacterium]|nr:hypothetical protein [Leptospiraceae bacterium]